METCFIQIYAGYPESMPVLRSIWQRLNEIASVRSEWQCLKAIASAPKRMAVPGVYTGSSGLKKNELLPEFMLRRLPRFDIPCQPVNIAGRNIQSE